ncbi:MAG TPA: hypothetical protein VG347_02030 [Verrucomicrobiae bacterium]|nr:hypothetical protein [Verrucomicrobiae bacterium]
MKDEFNKTPQDTQATVDVSTWLRLGLWFAAVIGVAGVFLTKNPVYFTLTLYFPMGLGSILPGKAGTDAVFLSWTYGGLAIGWGLYATLTMLLFTVAGRRAFIIHYIIFCGLLLLNTGGCLRMGDPTRHIE